jgi:hypothetical protein
MAQSNVEQQTEATRKIAAITDAIAASFQLKGVPESIVVKTTIVGALFNMTADALTTGQPIKAYVVGTGQVIGVIALTGLHGGGGASPIGRRNCCCRKLCAVDPRWRANNQSELLQPYITKVPLVCCQLKVKRHRRIRADRVTTESVIQFLLKRRSPNGCAFGYTVPSSRKQSWH